MKKIIKTAYFSLIILSPYLVLAEGLVPCTGADCDFNALITLIQNVIKWAVLIAPMLAAATFAYAGFLYITSGGDPGKVKSAHDIFLATLIGLVIVLVAWFVVSAILSGLGVAGGFNLLR